MFKVDISAENRLVQIHKPFLATDVYPEILLYYYYVFFLHYNRQHLYPFGFLHIWVESKVEFFFSIGSECRCFGESPVKPGNKKRWIGSFVVLEEEDSTTTFPMAL